MGKIGCRVGWTLTLYIVGLSPLPVSVNHAYGIQIQRDGKQKGLCSASMNGGPCGLYV